MTLAILAAFIVWELVATSVNLDDTEGQLMAVLMAFSVWALLS